MLYKSFIKKINEVKPINNVNESGEKGLLINCHSGLIPETRGLDSFKWAIYKKKIVGNTLHFIDHKTDFGEIITQSKTPLMQKDDLYLFSQRHYREEINMLVNFENNIKKKNIIKLSKCKPTMRMPIKIEKKMVESFDNWKSKFIKSQNN